jgi:hypothetical protein
MKSVFVMAKDSRCFRGDHGLGSKRKIGAKDVSMQQKIKKTKGLGPKTGRLYEKPWIRNNLKTGSWVSRFENRSNK